jgi:hypothetical protein
VQKQTTDVSKADKLLICLNNNLLYYSILLAGIGVGIDWLAVNKPSAHAKELLYNCLAQSYQE